MVMMRFGMNVGVDNNSPCIHMGMIKEMRIYVVAHKEYYEKKRYYFPCFVHHEYNVTTKIRKKMV